MACGTRTVRESKMRRRFDQSTQKSSLYNLAINNDFPPIPRRSLYKQVPVTIQLRRYTPSEVVRGSKRASLNAYR
eukprot:6194132-Pleurochrysis_carterae.AAC.1